MGERDGGVWPDVLEWAVRRERRVRRVTRVCWTGGRRRARKAAGRWCGG